MLSLAHFSHPQPAFRYMRLFKCLKGGRSDAELLEAHKEVLLVLHEIRHNVQKLLAASDMLAQERQMYTEKQDALRASIARMQEEIEARKQALERARVELKQNMQYEVRMCVHVCVYLSD
jgi:hypothetical protein